MRVDARIRALLHQVAREDGASAVEMALSCVILLAMLFGMCQFSLAMYYYQFTAEAAREGSRWAMVRGSTSCVNTPSLSKCNASTDDIKAFVQGLSTSGIKASKVVVTTVWCSVSASNPATWSSCSSTTSKAPGNQVKITVSYPYSFKIPFPRKPKSFSLTLGSTSQMVVSQ